MDYNSRVMRISIVIEQIEEKEDCKGYIIDNIAKIPIPFQGKNDLFKSISFSLNYADKYMTRRNGKTTFLMNYDKVAFENVVTMVFCVDELPNWEGRLQKNGDFFYFHSRKEAQAFLKYYCKGMKAVTEKI